MKSFFFFLIFLSAASPAFADVPASLSLDEAMCIASQKNVNAVVADERVHQALERYRQALSSFSPQVTAEISQDRQTKNLKAFGIDLPGTSSDVVGPFNSFDGRLRVTQLIFDLPAIERLTLVRDGHRLSKAQYEQARQDAMALVASLYLDAARARDGSRLAEWLLSRESVRLELAHRGLRNGSGDLLSVRQAKALYKEALASLAGARIRERERQLTLLTALGFPLESDIKFDAVKTLSAHGIPVEQEIIAIAKNSLDVEVARKALDERRSDLKAHWAELLPRIGVYADYGLSGEDPSRSDPTYAFGVKASVPIFEGGQRVFKIKESESRVRESKRGLEDVEKGSQIKASVAARDLERARLDLSAKDMGLLAASQKLALVETRYRNGNGSRWQFIDAGAETELAKDRRSESAAAYLLSQVAFLRSLGRVDEFVQQYGGVK